MDLEEINTTPKKYRKHVDIIEYTKLGMDDEVKKLIEEKANVNEKDKHGNYALIAAKRQ